MTYSLSKHRTIRCCAALLVGLAFIHAFPAAADDKDKPTVTPSERQVKECLPDGPPIKLQGAGGKVAEQTATTDCPPWSNDGDEKWEWTTTGKLKPDSAHGTDKSDLWLLTDKPAVGTAIVKKTQKWKDKAGKPPESPAKPDTESPSSTPVDVAIIKVSLDESPPYLVVKKEEVPSFMSRDSKGEALLCVQAGGVSWSIVLTVKPQTKKEDVKLRMVQTLQGYMKRFYRKPKNGKTGEMRGNGSWRVDGIDADADYQVIQYTLTNADIPRCSESAWDYEKITIDLQFEQFIQYKVGDTEWKTAKKATWKCNGVGVATRIKKGQDVYTVTGKTVTVRTSEFIDSTETPTDTPKSTAWKAF